MTLESFVENVDLSIVKLCAVARRMQGGHLRTLPGTRKGGEEFQVELPREVRNYSGKIYMPPHFEMSVIQSDPGTAILLQKTNYVS